MKTEAQPYNFPTPIISHRVANGQKTNLYFDAIIEAILFKIKNHGDFVINWSGL